MPVPVVLAVTSDKRASPSIGRVKSHSVSLTTASNAALARPGPISAMSAGVTGPSYDRSEPSGSVIFGIIRQTSFINLANYNLDRYNLNPPEKRSRPTSAQPISTYLAQTIALPESKLKTSGHTPRI